MKTVFLDVDTQRDFLYPAGALYVPKAERIVPLVAQLNRYAAQHGVPVISTVDAHSENDPEFAKWPHHCVSGSWGQLKADATLLEKRVTIPNREGGLEIEGAQQIILEKQTVDAFEAPQMARLVEKLGADRFVVYGVVTEICVLNAVRGLLKAGVKVIVATDAIEALKADDAKAALDEICQGGGMLAPSTEICTG